MRAKSVIAHTIVFVTTSSLPFFVYAQGDFRSYINTILGALTPVVPLLIGVGVLVFVWGVIRYIQHTDDPEGRRAAKQVMTFGILGIFVMTAFWGLVTIVVRFFNLNYGTLPDPKTLSI